MTISSEITNILNDLGSRFGVVIDWSSQNVVPYVQDLMARIAKLEMCNSIIAIVCGIACLVVVIFGAKWSIKYWDSDDCNEWAEIIIGVLVIVGLIGTCALIPVGIEGLTKAIYLPELTAIEYIQRLMK